MMRSIAASWTLTCRSAQRIATTMSRFSCSSWETPRSTVKWWDSVPRDQVRSSVMVRSVQRTARMIVVRPPADVVVVYVGLVLGNASNVRRFARADFSPKASSSRLCFSKLPKPPFS